MPVTVMPGIENPASVERRDNAIRVTAEAFAGKLAAAGVAISMDGRGRFMDYIFVERLWRSIKYEEVHLKLTPTAARRGTASAPG